MKVRIYLFPHYIGMSAVRMGSPILFKFLKEHGMEFDPIKWDGLHESLPINFPVMVRASTRMRCPPAILANRCNQLGHLVFYDDHLVGINFDFSNIVDDLLVTREPTDYERQSLLEAATAFLHSCQNPAT